MSKIDTAKVLAMSEDEQWKWADKQGLFSVTDAFEVSLADLAFRLRDEANKAKLSKAQETICQKVGMMGDGPALLQIHWWWLNESQPIHWILAAILAKEQADEKRSD